MALHSQEFTIFDAAAGTGMFSAAIELALAAIGLRGRTVLYCERDACAAAAIVARMESQAVHPAPVWDDLRTLDCEPWRGAVDCLCAGYPCAPFSSAGCRLGHRDPRHLWPAVHRAIAGIEPSIVFVENVAGHVGKGAGRVLRDLQKLGYRVTAGLYSSAECGASHQRKRLFILGLADANGRCLAGKPVSAGQRPEGRGAADDCGSGDELADILQSGQQNGRHPVPQWQSRAVRGCRELGHANGDQRQSRAVEAGHQRRPVARTRREELPRYAYPMDVDLAQIAKAICKAPSPIAARKTAADGIRLARTLFGHWAAVAAMDSTRMPAIESQLRGVASRMVPWSDRLRLAGNGVDPLAAAYAFLSLWTCLGE